MSEKIRFHVQLPKALKELIEQIAHDDDKSVGAVIRTAAKEYVEKRNKETKENERTKKSFKSQI